MTPVLRDWLVPRGRDVSPLKSILDVRHLALVYAEVLGYPALRFLRLTSSDYFGNVGRSYLGVPVLFSYSSPSFAAHVLCVVFGSSYKQMVGPHTGWIVAVVQAIQALRYGSMSKLVGGAMRELHDFFASEFDVDASVSMCACTGFPDPTPVCFLDLGP